MKNVFITTFVAISLVISSCGGKKNDLQSKKAELDKVKQEIASLQAKARTLEAEIAKLEPVADKSKLVETEILEAGAFESYLSIEGKADAEESTIATAQVPGTVTAVVVKPGDRVAAGQALAYLDNTALKQSRVQIEQQLSFANTLFEKQKRLWQQGVGTEVQYLGAKNQKEALEKNLATLDAQIAMYIVKAPISGTVESVDVKIGQAAAPGIPMFRVVNLNNLKVVADVAETFSSQIKAGDAVKVEFSDINKTIDSKITFASRVIDPLNRTFRVEIRLGNVAEAKPNMLARLRIVDYKAPNAVSVPTNAITRSDKEHFVMLMVTENGKTLAKRAVIKTGHTGDDRTEVLEGLKPGDKVIVNGFQELNDGQLISENSAAGK